MNWKPTAVLGVLGATLLTLARASTPVPPRSSLPPPVTAPPDPGSLFADVDRLRARLRAPHAPGTSSRNLFAFGDRDTRHTAAVVERPTAAATGPDAGTPPSPPPPASALRLIGLAEHAEPQGAVTTAILSGTGGLHFVTVNDVVDGYRVTAIRGDAIELSPEDASGSIVLTLK